MLKEVVLVTGGAGFIGSHLASSLLAEDFLVVVVDNLSGGHRRNVPPGAIFIKGSLTDAIFVESLFSKYKFDYVFHLAAYAAEGLSHFIRRFNYTNNLLGSVNLINNSVIHKVRRFIFTSSIAVYGRMSSPVDELMQPQPCDPYGIAKYAVEQDLKAAHDLFGLEYVILRPHNVYGPLQNYADPYRNVIGIFINQILNSRPLTVFGDGEQQRAFTAVEDIIPIFLQSIKSDSVRNSIFNIGNDTPVRINTLVQLISEAMQVSPTVSYQPARHEIVDCFADHSKMKKHFGVACSTPLTEGLGKMVQWAVDVGKQKPSWVAEVEISREMPKVWMDKGGGI